MLKLFFSLLTITLALAAAFIMVSAYTGITGRDYLALTVPWWHLLLHIAVALSALATSMTGVTMILDWRSKRVKLAGHPPQEA